MVSCGARYELRGEAAVNGHLGCDCTILWTLYCRFGSRFTNLSSFLSDSEVNTSVGFLTLHPHFPLTRVALAAKVSRSICVLSYAVAAATAAAPVNHVPHWACLRR